MLKLLVILFIIKLYACIKKLILFSSGKIKLSHTVFYTLQFWEMMYPKVVKYEKTIHTNTWWFCWHVILRVIWKTWYSSHKSYIIQTIIVYQHSAPTTGLIMYAGLYDHDNYQKVLLHLVKSIANSRYFYWKFPIFLSLLHLLTLFFASFCMYT